MIRIGITGNIAAGKSVVEKFLADLHYPVIDTDKVVHHLFNTSDYLNKQLRRTFGDYNIYTDGVLDRKKLAKIVFADRKYLKKLEDLTHPLVIEEIIKFFEANSNAQFAFVSVPLLYEVNWSYLFDKVIVVASDTNIRLNRLMQRRNLTEENALMRINAQMPQEEKIKFADYTIYNNTNYIDLSRQINEVLCDLI